MSDQGRQAGADIRQVSEKEKQELTEVLTKASLAQHLCYMNAHRANPLREKSGVA